MTSHEKSGSKSGKINLKPGLNGNGKASPKSNSGKAVWEYAKSDEAKDHIELKKQYDLFINGKWVKTSKYFNTVNPSNEEVIAKVASASEKDVDKAVNAAEKAYNNIWNKISAKERAKYIFRIARIMQEKARELAVIESMDGGKPIKESKNIDIPLAISHFFYYAGWTDKLEYAFPSLSHSFKGGKRRSGIQP